MCCTRLAHLSLIALVSPFGCAQDQDLALANVIDACKDASAIAPWVESVDSVELGGDAEADVRQVHHRGPVRGRDVEHPAHTRGWTGTVVLDVVRTQAGEGFALTEGTLKLDGLAPRHGRLLVDGHVLFESYHAMDGEEVVPDGDGYIFVPPSDAYREANIVGVLDFTGRWAGERDVDLTLKSETHYGYDAVRLEGDFGGRRVDRNW